MKRTDWVKPPEQETLHFSSGEGVKARTEGVPAADRVRISYGMISSKDANQGIDTALRAIGKVHRVPKDIYTVPVKVAGTLGGSSGRYEVWRTEIKVSRWAKGPAGVAAHEYGHFLDHRLFGSGQPSFSGMGTYQRNNKELAPLLTALYKSKAARQIALQHNKYVDHGNVRGVQAARYLLMPPEMFARSYAQWVGLRAGGHVKSDIKLFGDDWREKGRLHAQWEDADFAPIAREFDRLFARRGLLNRGRSR